MTSIDPEGPAAPSTAAPNLADPSLADLPANVLVVEDDPLIALDASETIRSFGVASVRTTGTVAAALQMIAERAPDFALLDVGLIHEKSFAVAGQLAALGIPFVFVTGYSGDAGIPADFARVPRLTKPYLRDALLNVLRAWRAGMS